jgi:hypothetical protein
MKTEKFMNYITAQIIAQIDNGMNADTMINVTDENEVSSMLGEKFWDDLSRDEQKIVLRHLCLKYYDEDATEVKNFFDITSFYRGRKWYPTQFFHKMEKHLMSRREVLGTEMYYHSEAILGFDLLITLDKDERILAKSFLNEFDDLTNGGNGFYCFKEIN